jgi:UDP-N-acetylglucosamine acyltransferase
MVLQFVRIGRHAFIGGMSGLANDVVPYAIYDGTPRAVYRTINRIGLQRYGFADEDLRAIHLVYSAVFAKNQENSVADRLKKIRKDVKNNKYAMDAIDFIENRSKRGLTPNMFFKPNAEKKD